jgi:hypothetical protein
MNLFVDVVWGFIMTCHLTESEALQTSGRSGAVTTEQENRCRGRRKSAGHVLPCDYTKRGEIQPEILHGQVINCTKGGGGY